MTIDHPTEADVKKKIKKALIDRGWYTWMPSANQYGSNGVSDHIALKGGIMLVIEAKLKEKKGTPLQEEFIKDIRAHGGYGMVVNMKLLPKFYETLDMLDVVIDNRQKDVLRRNQGQGQGS